MRQRSADSIHLQLVVTNSFKQLDAVARWSICRDYCTMICRRRQRLVQTRLNMGTIHVTAAFTLVAREAVMQQDSVMELNHVITIFILLIIFQIDKH